MDAEHVAEQLLPLDGPYEPDAVVEASRTVAELIRRLNRATRHITSLRYPSQLYQVLGGLSNMVHGLDQLLEQLAVHLDVWAHDPLLCHNGGADPSKAASSAGQILRSAIVARPQLSQPLDTARGIVSYLGVQE